jgi:hypothetical protein
VPSATNPVNITGSGSAAPATPSQPAEPKTWGNLPRRMATAPIKYAYEHPVKTGLGATGLIGGPMLFNKIAGEKTVAGPKAPEGSLEALDQDLRDAEMAFAERFGSSNPKEMLRRLEEQNKIEGE